MNVVLVADRPHGDRVDRELRFLGHEVTYVQDVHGAAYAAIHPGAGWVLAMNLHTDPERMHEKARECRARFIPLPLGWAKSREVLQRVGFPLQGQNLELLPVEEPAQALAIVPSPRAPFMFEAQAVRVVGELEDPRFVVADVCAALELSDPSAAVAGLDADELLREILGSGGQRREMLTVTEPGLYALLARSRKPAARRFDRWVRHEVLPAIRRTGAYVAPAAATTALDLRDPAALRGLLTQLAQVNLEQGKALTAARVELAEAAPKLQAWQHLMDSTGLVPLTLAGKAFNIQPLKFHDWMLAQGHVYRLGRSLMARQDHVDAGRMKQSTTTLIVNNEQILEFRAKLTGAGMAYFAERLELFRAACTPPRRAPRSNGSLLARAGVIGAAP